MWNEIKTVKNIIQIHKIIIWRREWARHRPYGWFPFPGRLCVSCCTDEGAKKLFTPHTRASPRRKREKRAVFCIQTQKGRERERERARTQHFLDERQRIKRVRTTRIILKNIFRVCSMGAHGKRMNEWSGWDLNGPRVAADGIILFIFRLITHQLSIY